MTVGLSSVPGTRLFAAFLLVGICFLSIFAMPAGAAQAVLTATATPAQVVLGPGDSAEGVLVVGNDGAAPVAVEIRPVVSDPSVTAEVQAAGVQIAAGESRWFTYTVSRKDEGTGQDTTVSLVVSSSVRSVVATVTVKAVASPVVVDAAVESAVGTINENRPGEAALVVRNPRESPAEVSSVAVTAPTSVEVTLTCPAGRTVTATDGATVSGKDCAFVVPPRNQVVLAVRFAAMETVVPGTRTATFHVHAGGTGVVVTTPVGVEVFGESDILAAVGVPVFLALPGMIIVLTGWYLVRRFTPWRSSGGEQSGGAAGVVAGTVVVGVAVSLGVAWIYPVLTETFFPGYVRDYTRAYGFLDFYYVFAYSFLLAVVFWLSALLAYYLRLGFRFLFLPEVGDSAGALLRKVGFRGLFGGATVFPKAEVGGRGGVILSRDKSGAALVVPRIVVMVDGAAGGELLAIETAAAGNHPFRLWREVRIRKARLRYLNSDVAEIVRTEEAKTTGQQVAIVQTAAGEGT